MLQPDVIAIVPVVRVEIPEPVVLSPLMELINVGAAA